MGLKLTAIPLADGRLRVNRWCMLKATEHAQEIENLWSTQVGNDSVRIDALAVHLIITAPREAGARISSRAMRFDSPSTAEPNGAERRRRPPAAASPIWRNDASANRNIARAHSRSPPTLPVVGRSASVCRRDQYHLASQEWDEPAGKSPMRPNRSFIRLAGLRRHLGMQSLGGSVCAATKRSRFMTPADRLVTGISKTFECLLELTSRTRRLLLDGMPSLLAKRLTFLAR
jgi:hypothetical protein